MPINRLLLTAIIISSACDVHAQNDSLNNDELIDYSQFGDASEVRRYATQKVINQSPTRIISIGYEYHGGFIMPDVPGNMSLPNASDYNVQKMSGFRGQVNLPVVSNDRIIWQMGVSYWGSYFRFKERTNSAFEKSLENNGLQTIGLQSTIFKPLNEKHWLILQLASDINISMSTFSAITYKAMTFSGTAVYGWKYSDKNMMGIGVARTYRAGALLHVPVFFWNKTFNDRYGMELLLPARGFVRRNFSTTQMLQIGYELEGNQYHIPGAGPNGELFLQRGELKPKLMWDQRISGYIWLNFQAGMRLNWRFDAMNTKSKTTTQDRFYEGKLTQPFFVSLHINFVSP